MIASAHSRAVLLAAVSSALPLAAQTLPPAAAPPAAACLDIADLRARHLHGLWRAEFQGQWEGATLLFEQHPEYPESLRGTINRDGERSQLAGDLEHGEFTLEESRDGRRISATLLSTRAALMA